MSWAEGPGMTVGETQSIGEGFSFREMENGAVQAKSNMIQVNCYKCQPSCNKCESRETHLCPLS